MSKLIEQFDFEWTDTQNGRTRPRRRRLTQADHSDGDTTDSADAHGSAAAGLISEERATLLYFIDVYNKHLVEIEGHPVRKTRETLDHFARELVAAQDDEDLERLLFKMRQFFSSYRVNEYAFVQKTIEDFRTIIWDFVDQLADDLAQEQSEDSEIRRSLDQLKEAVESNSVQSLKAHSRKFIDVYMDNQTKKNKRRGQRMKSIRKNLNVVKKQLQEANTSLRTDHLTQAFNRKTFDEYAAQHARLAPSSGQPVSLLLLDIDHFKKINDTYGHPIGDFVLKELAQLLKSFFNRDMDLVARIGGEEFAILLPDFQAEHAMKKAEELLQRVRTQVYVHEQHQLRFTISIGVAQLNVEPKPESVPEWVQRADQALYQSKNSGRNRATLADMPVTLKRVPGSF